MPGSAPSGKRIETSRAVAPLRAVLQRLRWRRLLSASLVDLIVALREELRA
jgi:hypothetical protein